MSPAGTVAVILDFDGVLVESAGIKARAFAELYGKYGGAVADRAVGYHLEHEGISRFQKFNYLHQTLLGITPSDDELAQLGARFSELVLNAVVSAPWVPGAREFLEAHHASIPLFVASGTPHEELRLIVARRGMERYFRAVFGTPASKREIIQSIVRSHEFDAAGVLMVGDAVDDLAGASQAGARFLGRTRPGSSPFGPGVVTLPDLTRLADFL